MNKVVYKESSFINYAGTKVRFILAAVSTKLEFPEYCGRGAVKKRLGIGAAVLHAGDEWNEELGKAIAYGKALARDDHAIYSMDPGMVNTKMVEAILEQEAAYMQMNPGRYIASYDAAKAKYEAEKAREKYLSSLTEAERLAIDVVANVQDLDKFLEAVEKRKKSVSTNNANLDRVSPES